MRRIGAAESGDGTTAPLHRDPRGSMPKLGQVASGRSCDLPVSKTPRSTHLHTIVESLPDGVIVVDGAGRIDIVNAAGRKIIGPGPYVQSVLEWPDAFGMYLPDTVTPCRADELPLAAVLRCDTSIDAEIFVRNRWMPRGISLDCSATPLRDQAGASCGALLVLRDLTERMDSFRQIRRLSSVVEQTVDSVLITDLKGKIIYVNPAFEQTTGYSAAEAIGRTPRFLKSGNHDAAFYRALWETVLAGRVYRGVLVNKRKSGQLFHSEQTITPIITDAGRFTNLVSVSRDITERRRVERQEADMDLAMAVQQRLYPKASHSLPGLAVAGAVTSADKMCGDYFDYFPMPNDCLGLAVGDVSGHGMGPSLIMVQARAILRSLALVYSDVEEVLQRLNQLLVADLAVQRYLTLALARLDLGRLTLAYASAGHVPGYLLDRRGDIREVLSSTGVPAGLFAERRFTPGRVYQLEPGDMVLLLTDGIIESGGHEGDEEFGAERALEYVQAHRHDPAGSIAGGLGRAARDFGPGGPIRDDMTVLICKIDERVLEWTTGSN